MIQALNISMRIEVWSEEVRFNLLRTLASRNCVLLDCGRRAAPETRMQLDLQLLVVQSEDFKAQAFTEHTQDLTQSRPVVGTQYLLTEYWQARDSDRWLSFASRSSTIRWVLLKEEAFHSRSWRLRLLLALVRKWRRKRCAILPTRV